MMRRCALTFVAAFAMLMLAAPSLTPVATAAGSVTYTPGWHIVGGPEGSVLSGASGPIYTWQALDTAYQSFPATTPLRAGWGYWAYFPTGGSIQLAQEGSPTVRFRAGRWSMVGNTFESGNSRLSQADIYLFRDGGYVAASTVPVGEGAWAYWHADAVGDVPPPSTAAPAPTSRYGSRANPVPIGTSAQIGDWRLTVLSVTPNANSLMPASRPAPAGTNYFFARVQVTYTGTSSARFIDWRLYAVGASAVAKSSYCGTMPDELPASEVFPGGTVTGNVCWTIAGGDAASLVMYDSYQDSSERIYFSLH